jgi:RNA polymerase sigma factor (sigma-70 family)
LYNTPNRIHIHDTSRQKLLKLPMGGEILNKETVDVKITEAAKTVFSYCLARTATREEAEDLAQDILLEILKLHRNIRDDQAFYGFMWAVAGNVCRNWYRKRAKRVHLELDDNTSDDSDLDSQLALNGDLALLRRELSLLSDHHRKVTIAYYFSGLSVREISKAQHLSESMVKYLLFKTRQILKGGMNMDREYGELCYNPRKLTLAIWGSLTNKARPQCPRNMIAQNILMACYNERCTAQEISLQIGVAVPYLEQDLNALSEFGALIKTGSKYATNLVIFTKEYTVETGIKTLPIQKVVTERVSRFLDENEAAIRGIGFSGNDMSVNLYRWQLAVIILSEAISKYLKSVNIQYPKTVWGDEAIIWAEELYGPESLGALTRDFSNKAGDRIKFYDLHINGQPRVLYFHDHQNRAALLLDIAGGNMDNLKENDHEEIAGFIINGIARKENDRIISNFPIFTQAQFSKLLDIIDPIATLVAEKTTEMAHVATEILIEHAPLYLKETAQNMGWLKMFNAAIAAPVKNMLDSGYLTPPSQMEIPTAYIVLAK